jgi:hypothetical protein
LIRSLPVRLIAASAFAGAVVLSGPVAVQAQGQAPAAHKQQEITANPFLLTFQWFNVEYAREHKASTTWGASASFLGFSDADYQNVAAFYRYYPQGRALNGFFVGGRGGVHHVSFVAESGLAYGLGFEIGYDWLLGRERNFAISIGAGATRLFGGDIDGASVAFPTVRLVNLGWRF